MFVRLRVGIRARARVDGCVSRLCGWLEWRGRGCRLRLLVLEVDEIRRVGDRCWGGSDGWLRLLGLEVNKVCGLSSGVGLRLRTRVGRGLFADIKSQCVLPGGRLGGIVTNGGVCICFWARAHLVCVVSLECFFRNIFESPVAYDALRDVIVL